MWVPFATHAALITGVVLAVAVTTMRWRLTAGFERVGDVRLDHPSHSRRASRPFCVRDPLGRVVIASSATDSRLDAAPERAERSGPRRCELECETNITTRSSPPVQAPPHRRDRHASTSGDQGCVGPGKVPHSRRRTGILKKSSSTGAPSEGWTKLVADRVFQTARYGNLHTAIRQAAHG